MTKKNIQNIGDLNPLDRREYEEGVECIAAPLWDHLVNVIAAISISGPQRKIGTPHERDFVNQVVEASGLISSKMGYRREVRGRGKNDSREI